MAIPADTCPREARAEMAIATFAEGLMGVHTHHKGPQVRPMYKMRHCKVSLELQSWGDTQTPCRDNAQIRTQPTAAKFEVKRMATWGLAQRETFEGPGALREKKLMCGYCCVLYVFIWLCACTCVHTYVWRPDIDLRHLP